MRPNGIGARYGLRALGVVTTTLAALITSTSAVAAAPADEEDYSCVESIEVCEAAGQQAGGSAQRAEQFLRDYADAKAASPSTQFAAAAAGLGYLINPGPGGRRYFGWRLSRSIATGDKIGLYRCRLLNGRPVFCRYIGDIGVQAEYFLRNRYVSDIKTVVVNLMRENFSVRHIATCMVPSTECISQPGSMGALNASASSTAGYRDFQLRTRGGYWMTFQWEVYDPVTRTTPRTSPRGSISFNCTVYSLSNPGDCYFDARNPGGDH